MPVNYPTWVDDTTAVPLTYLTPAKRLLYLLAAAETARRLHNAVHAWFRGDQLTAAEQSLLAETFPQRWPDPPTATQLRVWLRDVWQPRHNQVHGALAAARKRIENFDLSWVDWDGLIG